MAVRIKDGEVPYTWWIGIEITNNHVINVLLRELNNLIHVNENRELYVDLQLDDWITPEDSLPVWVTTGRILQEDWRPQSWTILNWKTTSWDQVSLIYANDDCLYYSVNWWAWRLLGGWEGELSNVKAFYLEDLSDLTNWQWAYDWYADGKMPIVSYNNDTYVMESYYEEDWAWWIRLIDTRSTVYEQWQNGVSYVWTNKMYIRYNDQWEVTRIDVTMVPISPSVIDAYTNYQFAYTPTQGYNPATKQYVDDGLATKQDTLIAWTNITIAADGKTISATMPSALVYKWNVQTINDLPSSWQTVGDTYFVEWVDWMYSWDWTQWNYVGSTSPSLTNYFNKTVDDSDDITEWSIHLFVTQNEKNIWNNKQDALTAGTNINIDANNVISTPSYTWGNQISISNYVVNNDAPFTPDNDWVLGQVLKKTSTGYEWKNDSSNFNPENEGTTGQVLKKTDTGYAWANESWWWGWGWGTSYNAGYGIGIVWHTISNTKPFDPASWTATAGQVLTKTTNGYKWEDIDLPSGENNVKFWTLNSNVQDPTTQQEIYERVSADSNNWAIINDTYTNDVFVFYKFDSSDTAIFYGTKRISRVSNAWNYTSQYQQELKIHDSTLSYAMLVHENPDDATHTNYLSAIGASYNPNDPFIPTEQYQPATKEYVDRVASWSITWVITQNVTWTTYSASQIWVWTQAQYDLITPVNWVIYNIIPS